MAEGRERIRNLRSEAANSIPLPEALALLGEDLKNIAPLIFEITVEGTQRGIVPVIQDEIYFIAREALLNAFTHSQGSTVELTSTRRVGFASEGPRRRVGV